MGDLTKNFSRHEFRCHHCGELLLHPWLPMTLQQIRDFCSRIEGKGVTIIVSSGYRCPVHNAKEGGEVDSNHMLGMAADIWSPVITAKRLHDLILQGYREKRFTHLGGVGYYPRKHFVHVDVEVIDHLRRWTG